MYLMIDNYDSFVYNLKAYFEELGRKILVRRSDQITMEEIEEMNPEGIILSPGPKRPWDAAVCVEAVRRFQGRIPILGVCLGHQVLGFCSGASVHKGERPMHGKVTPLHNQGTGERLACVTLEDTETCELHLLIDQEVIEFFTNRGSSYGAVETEENVLGGNLLVKSEIPVDEITYHRFEV